MLILLLLPVLARALQCYNDSGVATTSVYGVECVECNLDGYLTASGCVCYSTSVTATCGPIPASSQVVVASSCGPAYCMDEDRCVVSSYGVNCMECGYAGFINLQSYCQCYDKQANPNAQCSIIYSPDYIQNVNETIYNSTCSCFNSTDLGFFKNPNCAFCTLEALGPPPGSTLLPTECNTYGGQDPQLNSTIAFSTCWGHGIWNAKEYNCTCSPTWRPVLTPLTGIYQEPVYGCLDCVNFWGPPPLESVAACSVVWAPDPNDGVFKECSGHGTFIDGACACEGHWALVQVGGVMTCGACDGGFLLPLCGGQSLAPTARPTAANVTQMYMAALPASVQLGTLGNRTATNAACLAAFPSTCNQAYAMLCYSGDALVDMPANYSFPATSNIIFLNNTAQNILATDMGSFNQYLNAEAYVLEIIGSGPVNIGPGTFDILAFGCTMTATTGSNCADFTSTAGSVESPGGTFDTCSTIIGLICLCTQSTITPPPVYTAAPS